MPAFVAIFCCTAAGMNFAIGPLPPSAFEHDVAEPRRAHVGARPLVQLVEEGARLGGGTRRRDRAHDAALLDDVLERLEFDFVAGKFLAYIGDHNGVPQVRLVGAVFQHCLGVGNARKFLSHGLAAGKFLEHPAQYGLHYREHVVLRDKAHLDVELIKLAGRAVGARILVAKAGRDLKVAIEARNHNQLLELLRRLRQRVELAGVQTRGHEKIARTLGRACRENRRLKLEEALLLHAAAKTVDDRAAFDDVVVNALAPQIQEAVFQPDVLGIFLLAEHRHRQLAGGAEHLDLGDEDFDRAGGELRIFRAGRALAHLAVDSHHPFGAQLLGGLEGGRIRIGDDLRQAVVVAEIDEQEAAMVADAVAPAGEPHRLADMQLAQRAASMRAIAMHLCPTRERSRKTGECITQLARPAKRGKGRSASGD